MGTLSGYAALLFEAVTAMFRVHLVIWCLYGHANTGGQGFPLAPERHEGCVPRGWVRTVRTCRGVMSFTFVDPVMNDCQKRPKLTGSMHKTIIAAFIRPDIMRLSCWLGNPPLNRH